MKKFLRMLNDFLYVREYEKRVAEREKRIKSELRYVQDLLLAETAFGPQEAHFTSAEKKAQVNVYVAYLKVERTNEAKWKDLIRKI